MGRVLLAGLPDAEVAAFLAGARLERQTDRTITDPGRLRAAVDEVRERGWALVDQELELGLRSMAAPLRAGGQTVAALNVAVAAPRVGLGELRDTILPELLAAAARISEALDRGPQSAAASVDGHGSPVS
jgi:IclR family pca regulon transcriptional regulator